MKTTFKKIAVICISMLSVVSSMAQGSDESSNINVTAMDVAPLMVPGWNLGNTLEAPVESWMSSELQAETYWQPTKTTQRVIDFVKEQGFNSIRIPCSWFVHMNSNYEISTTWLRRVKQVVDYCIKDSLYVMLNDHYDTGWIERSFGDISEENIQEKSQILANMWTQIATYFRGYDEHLLFAGMNEPDAENEEQYAVLKRYNQTFVDAVRATGGNNTNRILVAQAPCTDIDRAYDYDARPTDSTPNALMLEVHFYSPYQFIGMNEDQWWGKMQYYWGRNNHVTGSDRNSDSKYEESYVMQEMRKLYTKYSSKGTPVIIGEYGGTWRKLSEEDDADKHNASIHDWYKAVTQYAITYGAVPMVWDTNYANVPSGTVIDRKNCVIYNPYAMEGITDGVAVGKWPAISAVESITVDEAHSSSQAYNLMGMPVQKGYRGIVIINGKKKLLR